VTETFSRDSVNERDAISNAKMDGTVICRFPLILLYYYVLMYFVCAQFGVLVIL